MGTASDHPEQTRCVDANAASIDEKLGWVRWTQRLLALEVVYLVGLIIIRPYLG
ncbi:MAG: hypothetical protein ACR2GT_10160 [Gaiellaceae bacterium]